MTIAAVVCIAASNGGSTAQDLKTGYLVGATPRHQQLAIMIGALTSALVIGGTLLLLNKAGTVYTTNPEYLPKYHVADVSKLTDMERPGGEYAAKDPKTYHVLHVAEGEIPDVAQGRYLVDDAGQIRYLVDPAINGRVKKRDDGTAVANKFEAPKTRLMALIVGGILNQKLPWALVLMGVLIAVTVELMGVPSLAFAVGVYLPISSSAPIFIGGILRWIIDRRRKTPAGETEMSPGSLISTGYIAGGTIGGVVVAFLSFSDKWRNGIDLTSKLGAVWNNSQWPATIAFGLLILILLYAGMQRPAPVAAEVPKYPPQKQ
jgi:hypothetical protein